MPKIRRCTFKSFENKNGKLISKDVNGMWHQWGQAYKECNIQGMVQVTVGIIEGDDGQMYQSEVQYIKFHKPLVESL